MSDITDPLTRHLLGLPRLKPFCVCQHAHAMHALGKCAMNRGQGIPGSCWCDGYEPSDECAHSFPVMALEQPKDE